MRKPKFKDGKAIISEIKKLSKKYGVSAVRWACNKYSKETNQRAKLIREKRAIEKALRELR